MENNSNNPNRCLWLVYDGDCPLCKRAALAVRIRKAAGKLELVNARDDIHHPVLRDVISKGFDLDEGIVVKFEEQYYAGADALHMLALLTTRQGWFNRINAFVFGSKTLSRFCYPVMRSIRYLLLKLNHIPKFKDGNP